MGADVHVFFETLDYDGGWHLTFPRRPSKWWFEELIDQKIEDGSAITIFGPPTEEEMDKIRSEEGWQLPPTDDELIEASLGRKLRTHFEEMSDDEIISQYGEYNWFESSYLPEETPAITLRGYEWFAKISAESVRRRFTPYDDGPETFESFQPIPTRGIPDDVTPEVSLEIRNYGEDGHSHSWLRVNEILGDSRFSGLSKYDCPELPFAQYKWLEENIIDPANTRMVFFFDN